MQSIEEPSQQGINNAFRVYARSPEKHGRKEQHTDPANRVPAKFFIKYAEQRDLSAKGEKGKEEGIYIKVVEGEEVEKDMHPFDDVVWPIRRVDEVSVARPKIGEAHRQVMTGGKAVLEEAPDISMLRIIFIGYQVMQASHPHSY